MVWCFCRFQYKPVKDFWKWERILKAKFFHHINVWIWQKENNCRADISCYIFCHENISVSDSNEHTWTLIFLHFCYDWFYKENRFWYFYGTDELGSEWEQIHFQGFLKLLSLCVCVCVSGRRPEQQHWSRLISPWCNLKHWKSRWCFCHLLTWTHQAFNRKRKKKKHLSFDFVDNKFAFYGCFVDILDQRATLQLEKSDKKRKKKQKTFPSKNVHRCFNCTSRCLLSCSASAAGQLLFNLSSKTCKFSVFFSFERKKQSFLCLMKQYAASEDPATAQCSKGVAQAGLLQGLWKENEKEVF